MTPDTVLAVATAPKRNSTHWRQGSVTWGELIEWSANPADKKEAGNYLLGTLRETTVAHRTGDEPCTRLHRRKDAVVSRSALTLDVDSPAEGFADGIELTWPGAALLHTTYSSSPDDLRYRLILPTDRSMTPDEYHAAATVLMHQLGIDSFDKGSAEPERYMFKPSASEPEWYTRVVLDGDPVTVDDLLVDFEDDLSAKPMPSVHRNKRDPFEIEGVVGAFNSAYRDWAQLIDVYELPYEEAGSERWQLTGSRAVAGMGQVTEGLVYSHHANDPAYGQTCSAFDLVRLHRFGELDEDTPEQTPVNRRPSHKAMLDLASTDHRVTAELVGASFGELTDEDEAGNEDWRLQLRLAPRTGAFVDTITNWDLVVAHDRAFSGLRFNLLTMQIEVDRDLPWRETAKMPTFGEVDRWALVHYIERTYNIRPAKSLIDSLVDTKAQQHQHNPLAEYLEGLVWDRKERLETCLPGVVPTGWTRVVARKSMVAAAARALDPGCKWDHTLVLFGNEGLGKSWWVEKVARGHSAPLGRIDNKDTLLVMQRSWIMISDEGHSLKKGDADMLKEFLTKTQDVFRMPYDRETLAHPRHSVIWSTTNDQVFLRRQQGNRRFLIVHCEDKVDFDLITDDYVDQLWAEAVYLYKAGERLYLDATESEVAAKERETYTEEDALAGVITEYLDTLVPETWDDMTPESRRAWLLEASELGLTTEGTRPITRVCSAQVWHEALGRPYAQHRRVDLLEITETLRRLEGWEQLPGRHRIPGYGPQVVFGRRVEEDFSDLI